MLERAAGMCVVLLSLSFAAQAAASRLAQRRSSIQVSGKASHRYAVGLGRSRPFVRAALLGFGLVFVAVPIATIAWTSMERTFADPLVLTSMHWRNVLGRSETTRAFFHSSLLAVLSGLIVALLGLVIARVAKARGGWLAPGFASVASAPYAVPGTVLAIGLILAFHREIRVVIFEAITFALFLPGTLGILLAAYGVKYLAFGVRGARAALDQVHPSLEEAARVSGAGPIRGMMDVVLPLISPALGAAFLLVALPCLSELTMSVLLFGPGTETAGTLLFELQSYSDPPAAAVVATLIVLVAVAGDLVAKRLDRTFP